MAPAGQGYGGVVTAPTPQRRELPVRPSSAPGRRSAGARLLPVGVVGTAVTVAVGVSWQWAFAPLVGWDVAAAGFVAVTWWRIRGLGPEQTAELAVREDPTRASADLLLLAAAVASLVGVGFVLASAGSATGSDKGFLVALGIGSVVASWSVVHLVFTLRYAGLYYSGEDGGIDFNQEEPPRYSDFAYVAFTIGMTFQVSDTDLRTTAVRATALRQALLSYLFGTVIIAMTINVVAGLSK